MLAVELGLLLLIAQLANEVLAVAHLLVLHLETRCLEQAALLLGGVHHQGALALFAHLSTVYNSLCILGKAFIGAVKEGEGRSEENFWDRLVINILRMLK